MKWWPVLGVAVALLTGPVQADDSKKPAAVKGAGQSFQVPYRLTDTKHLLIRAKIDGKGPYNFILDTGAPALFVGTAVCKKLGIEADKQGWGTFNRFEIEGGAVLEKFPGRVEDPFQLEGMNGLGLAGVTLHGIIGYTVLARYRIELDLTKDKMVWTRLNFDPPAPVGLAGKGGGAPGGLDAIGGIMKMMGALLGMSKPPDPKPRGFLGLELKDMAGTLLIEGLVQKGPAAEAGLKAGDRVTHLAGKEVNSQADFQKLTAKLVAGQELEIKVQRSGTQHTIRVTAGQGL
jgi:hypothetical protein